MATLKDLREQAGLTQADLAELLDLQQSRVSRIESDPGILPSTMILGWARTLGVTVEELLAAMGPPAPLEVEPLRPDPQQLESVRRNLDAVRTTLTELAGVDHDPLEEFGGPGHGRPLARLVEELHRMPRVAVFGKFDAGKSTLLNSLLGIDVLPAGYRPLTNAVTVLRHVDRRPAWMGEFEVVMLDATMRPDELDGEEFDPAQVVLKTHADVLAVRGHHDADVPGVAMIVGYLDSDILRACDLVDLPGFGSTGRDDDTALGLTSQASSEPAVAPDVVLYLSGISGFMDPEDIQQLSSVVSRIGLERLRGHLAVVATHAHPHVTNEEMGNAFEAARNRLGDEPKLSRQLDDVPFHSYFREDPSRSQGLWSWLDNVLTRELPDEIEARTRASCDESRELAVRKLDELIEAYEEEVLDADAEEHPDVDQLREAVADARDRLDTSIREARSRSQEDWSAHADRIVDVEHVKSVLKGRSWKRKEAAQRLPRHMMAELTDTLQDIVTDNTEHVLAEVEGVLGDLEVTLEEMDAGWRLKSAGFEPRGAFAGGLAGAVAVGGLAAWASTMGNLGGYILVAKGVSALSAAGVSVTGGTAGAISAVSTIGGPATLAVGLVVVGALTGLALTGAGWEGRLAKQLVAQFDKHHVVRELTGKLDAYWDDTMSAAMRALDAVEEQAESAASAPEASPEVVLSELRRRRGIWEGIAMPEPRCTGQFDSAAPD